MQIWAFYVFYFAQETLVDFFFFFKSLVSKVSCTEEQNKLTNNPPILPKPTTATNRDRQIV